MKNLILLFVSLLFCTHLGAQKTGPTTTTTPARVVDFTTTLEGYAYRFTPIPAPLQQKAGAPPAFWTYYWEFGDGSFSFEEKPLHAYKKAGSYNPILEATAHYDDGGRPKGKSASLLAMQTGNDPRGLPTAFDSTQQAIRMRPSRQARAEEEMVCILSYRNLGRVRTDGRLHVFFNERNFPSHFALDSARLHFSEMADDAVSQVFPGEALPTNGWTVLNLPSHTGVSTSLSGEFPLNTPLEKLLDTARRDYRDEKIWRFNNLLPNEKRNLFVALRGTANMLKDTSAFIHVEAIFAPFDPAVLPERFILEFEIVSSHDPNAILVSDSRVNYRSIGAKKIDYKVQFQNNGEGPASTVELKVEIPEGLDMKRMRPLDWYPKCPICPQPATNRSCIDTASSKEGLLFTFRNIYLPGTRQEGVDDRDSTKGFVRYRIEAEHGMPKRSFRSRAKITFDKNDPIYTNYTRTRFKVGLSPGLKVGYGFETSPNDSTTGLRGIEEFTQGGYVFFGLSISPFKSWRVYPQLELLTGIKGQTTGPETQMDFVDTISHNIVNGIVIDTLSFKTITSQSSTGHFSFELPVMLRKNFSRFFGAGLGGSCRVLFENGKTVSQTQERVVVQISGLSPELNSETLFAPVETSNRVTHFRYTAFADLTFGSVRKGLSLGIRGGAMLEQKQKMRPFAQLSLELKL
ncbi:MAG: PKD domain-containing protein [Phycisphaerae bacterium]|nr:PKD domain-containing protein [Saprospiraceae bacterium]